MTLTELRTALDRANAKVNYLNTMLGVLNNLCNRMETLKSSVKTSVYRTASADILATLIGRRQRIEKQLDTARVVRDRLAQRLEAGDYDYEQIAMADFSKIEERLIALLGSGPVTLRHYYGPAMEATLKRNHDTTRRRVRPPEPQDIRRRPETREMGERVQSLRDAHAVQSVPGNRRANEYMRGMFNGMELALAIMEGREPNYDGEEVPAEAPDANEVERRLPLASDKKLRRELERRGHSVQLSYDAVPETQTFSAYQVSMPMTLVNACETLCVLFERNASFPWGNGPEQTDFVNAWRKVRPNSDDNPNPGEEVKEEPKLGLATTDELLKELQARIEVQGLSSYRTVDNVD